MQKGFLYGVFSHTDFFPEILIFLIVYTDFVLDQSGRSAFGIFCITLSVCLRISIWNSFFHSKLQGLRLSNLPGVKHLGLLTLQLEEHLPGLTVLGVTEEELAAPAWQHRGESRLVRALLGFIDEKTDPDPFAVADEATLEICEDDSYIYKRRILKAD